MAKLGVKGLAEAFHIVAQAGFDLTPVTLPLQRQKSPPRQADARGGLKALFSLATPAPPAAPLRASSARRSPQHDEGEKRRLPVPK